MRLLSLALAAIVTRKKIATTNATLQLRSLCISISGLVDMRFVLISSGLAT
jgi:hypothetical protein